MRSNLKRLSSLMIGTSRASTSPFEIPTLEYIPLSLEEDIDEQEEDPVEDPKLNPMEIMAIDPAILPALPV
ncbi:hypothetical protein RJT34_16370 [Clitoria ternatea]|uniref:Uncharacterized protein n=1 Tax=Clitoria ternatea TaxID=43366 RepID=A0AAN9J922_CLITE